MTQSFSNFVGASPPQDNLLLARLVQEARQGGTRGRLAVNQLRRLPGGREALQAVIAPAPPPAAPAPPPVAAAPPAPAPMAPPPQASPSFFDQTLGRGIGAAGRGVLGVGRFVQPVTTPVLENLGKAIETGMSGAVSTVGAVTPGDFMGLESNLAEERARRGIQSSLPKFLQASPLFTLESLIKGNAAQELQAQAAAWRATDMPSTRLNALPGQGIPLPGGKRLDEIDVGVKGAFELLPELALGIATGGGSAAGSLGRRAAVSAANVAGADIAKLGAKGALGAGRAATRGAKAVIPSRSAARQADVAARGAGGSNTSVSSRQQLQGLEPLAKQMQDGSQSGAVIGGAFERLGDAFREALKPAPQQDYISNRLQAINVFTNSPLDIQAASPQLRQHVKEYISELDNFTLSTPQQRKIAEQMRSFARQINPEAPTTPATGTAAAVEPKQLSFKFIDDPEIDPITGKASVVDEVFEVNQTKAVEPPAGYAPGLVEDLIPKIASPDLFRKAIEASKAVLRRVPSLDETAQLKPSTLPGMAVSAMIKAAAPRIQSTANRLSNEIQGKIREVNPNTNESIFTFDDATNKLGRRIKGQTGLRIQNIDGVAGSGLEANPTIADLAQNFGAYKPYLNNQQIETMEFLRIRADGLAADLEAYGIPVENKIALGEDGFFISRGPTKQETRDLMGGQVRVKGRTYDKGREYKTQVEALLDPDQINEYLPVWNEMGHWSSEIYETVLDQQAGKFLINYVDPKTGKKIATSLVNEEIQTLRAKIRARIERQKLQEVRVINAKTAYHRASKAVEDITDTIVDLAKKADSAASANELSKILIRANKETKKKLAKLEKTSNDAKGKADIAKMRADDLEDDVDRLLDFENSQSDLLANSAQRLESMQLAGVSAPDVLTRAAKEVKDLERFVQRIVDLRENAQKRLVTKRNAEEAAYFDSADADRTLANVSGKERVPLDFLDVPNDPAAALAQARRDLSKMKVQATKRFNEEKARSGNLGTAQGRLDDNTREIANLQKRLDRLQKKFELEQRANKGKTAPVTGFRSLNSYELDIPDLDTILRTRKGMQGLSGKGSELLAPFGAYQNLRRTVGATLDDSGTSIQGKAFQFSNPREFYFAWKAHLQSLVGKPGRKGKRLQREAMADNIRDFDKESQAMGAPSSHEIIDRMGIRHGGVDTEVTLREGGISGQFGKLPLLRRANEAFGAFGDMLRLHGARGEIMEYMRLSGKTFDELVADGTARQIGNGVNGITGWTPNGVAGALGDTLLFAPRFFRARIETLHRATKGMDVDFMIDALPFDRQIRRNLNINHGIRNSIDADQLIARRAVMKLVSMGTLITVAANEALGQETDFQLMKNGRMNPNFMSVRLTKIGAPRDWNIFGPYKSMAALLLASAGGAGEKDLGKATDAWLNLSSPIVGDIAEFISFKSIGESRFGETLGEYMANSHIPFSLQEVPNIIKESATGNPKDAFGGALSIGLETIGEQSSALSRSDILQDRVTGLFKEGKLSADNYEDLEPYEQNDVKDALVAELEKFDAETAATGKPFKRFFATIDIINRRRDSQLQEALVFYNAGRRSDGSEYTKREFTNDYFDIIDDARERKDQVKETLGVEFEDKIPADDDLEAQALKAWHEAPSQSLTAAGNYLPDKVKVLRNKVLADYPEQVDYIYRNTNDTPLPAGFLEALVRAGLESQVEKIMRSKAARAALGAPPQPTVPSSTLTPPEQPAMGGGSITPMPPPLGSNPALKGLLKVAQ